MSAYTKALTLNGILMGVGLGLLLGASVPAWAAATPEQVKKAVDAGDLPAAEHMLRDAIREHGDSARAHYELGEVLGMEGLHQDAVGELELARKMDPTLHFARSPETFQQHLAREQSFLKPAAEPAPAPKPTPEPKLAAPVVSQSVSHPSAPPAKTPDDGGMTIILVVGGLLLAGLAIFMVFRRSRPAYGGSYRPATGPVPPPYPQSAPPVYGQPGYAPVVVQDNSGSSFLTGMVVGELMSGGHHHDTVIHETVVNNVTENRVYETERRPDPSFDSGSSSSDGWGGSSDGGASSSSFDSGSSSSDNSSW
ncbi:tetratricopeptide repeat protein [Nitrospirillum pindoramense]|uniref:Tetratricopeptide repeat protein n=1 Tax=Nitrospirillum amazonense TaxID=28077 RepID=A0A560HII9_9PROT|nr:tetratricopeptide repeat protein [Nitrospirillum amazonense]TWB45244.1 tetratricopeptide repeat protein [Nitrospirillum amazonense]